MGTSKFLNCTTMTSIPTQQSNSPEWDAQIRRKTNTNHHIGQNQNQRKQSERSSGCIMHGEKCNVRGKGRTPKRWCEARWRQSRRRFSRRGPWSRRRRKEQPFWHFWWVIGKQKWQRRQKPMEKKGWCWNWRERWSPCSCRRYGRVSSGDGPRSLWSRTSDSNWKRKGICCCCCCS